MATKGSNGLTGTYMYRLLTTDKGRYQLTTERLMSQFSRSAKSSETDGTFRAVCLSGIRSDNNTGTGPDANDASIEGRYIEIIVRPLVPIGDIVPDPRLSTTPEAINDDITTIGAMYTARSDFGFKGQNPIPFGHEVNCYFEKGSIANSDLTGLRFQDPGEDTIPVPSYVKLATIEGVMTGATAFENGLASLLGSPVGTSDTTSPAQLAFIDKLGKALRGKGLKFHVTDRSRTVDDQMNRIMNKYKNNSPAEVITAYREGAAMVKAIQSNDTATFRKLAGRSSKHLKGNAIDIRSRWYTDDEIPIVLGIIREVGGNPLLENIEGCWTAAGRNVTTTKRVQGAKPGGRGKNTPCHNEHIHIDIPEDFK